MYPNTDAHIVAVLFMGGAAGLSDTGLTWRAIVRKSGAAVHLRGLLNRLNFRILGRYFMPGTSGHNAGGDKTSDETLNNLSRPAFDQALDSIIENLPFQPDTAT